MSHTLVLGPDYQPQSWLPLSTIHWHDAVRLFFLEKVSVLHWYDDWVVHSAKLTMRVPAVIVTKTGFSKRKAAVAFTRGNVFLRDLYQCGYCSDILHPRDLTIDHVIPKAKGGKHKWDNVISSCKSCNHHKGNKLWKPLWTPKKPDYFEIAGAVKKSIREVAHESWAAYLGVELEDNNAA